MSTSPIDHQPYNMVEMNGPVGVGAGGANDPTPTVSPQGNNNNTTFSTPRYRGPSVASTASGSTGSPGQGGRNLPHHGARGSGMTHHSHGPLHVQTSQRSLNIQQQAGGGNELDAFATGEEDEEGVGMEDATEQLYFPCCGTCCGRPSCCCGRRCMWLQQSVCGLWQRIWYALRHLDWLLVFTMVVAGILAVILRVFFQDATWEPNDAWRWPTMYFACCVFYQCARGVEYILVGILSVTVNTFMWQLYFYLSAFRGSLRFLLLGIFFVYCNSNEYFIMPESVYKFLSPYFFVVVAQILRKMFTKRLMLSYNQKNYAQRIKSLLTRDEVLHKLVDPDEYHEDLEAKLRLMLASRGVKSGSQRNVNASTETLSTASVGLTHGGSSSVLPSPHTPVVGSGTIFNRLLQKLKDGTAHLAHHQSSHHEARQTAKAIFDNVDRRGKGYLEVDDFCHFFMTPVLARKALDLFPQTQHGRISKQDMTHGVQKFLKDRRDMASELKDWEHISDALVNSIRGFFWGTIVICLMIFYGNSVATVVLPLSTVLVIFTMTFGNAAKNTLDSFVFVFGIKPYAVGDRVDLPECGPDIRYYVHSVQLLSTTFRTMNNRLMILSNWVLCNKIIVNHTRGLNAIYELTYIVDLRTPMDAINALKASLLEHLKSKPLDWKPVVNLCIYDVVTNDNTMKLGFWVENQKCWKETREDVGFGPVRTDLMITMKALFAKHRIGHNLPKDEPVVKMATPSTDPFNGDDTKIRMFAGPPTPGAGPVPVPLPQQISPSSMPPTVITASDALTSIISPTSNGTGSGASTPSAPSSGGIAMKKYQLPDTMTNNNNNNNPRSMLDDEAAAIAAATSYQLAIQQSAGRRGSGSAASGGTGHNRYGSNGGSQGSFYIPGSANSSPIVTPPIIASSNSIFATSANNNNNTPAPPPAVAPSAHTNNAGEISLRIDAMTASPPMPPSLPTSRAGQQPPPMSLPDRGAAVIFGPPVSVSTTAASFGPSPLLSTRNAQRAMVASQVMGSPLADLFKPPQQTPGRTNRTLTSIIIQPSTSPLVTPRSNANAAAVAQANAIQLAISGAVPTSSTAVVSPPVTSSSSPFLPLPPVTLSPVPSPTISPVNRVDNTSNNGNGNNGMTMTMNMNGVTPPPILTARTLAEAKRD